VSLLIPWAFDIKHRASLLPVGLVKNHVRIPLRVLTSYKGSPVTNQLAMAVTHLDNNGYDAGAGAAITDA
jgi:hypothetical protein